MTTGIRELCDELNDGFVSNYVRNDLIVEPDYKGLDFIFIILFTLLVTSYCY